MQKKYNLFVFGIALIVILSAILVYAFVRDTDGGFNIYEPGTCTDNYGSYQDYCMTDDSDPSKNDLLVEYFPNNMNPSRCTGTFGGYSCSAGSNGNLRCLTSNGSSTGPGGYCGSWWH